MILLDRKRALERNLDLAAYVDAGPMPYQGAAESARRLDEAGFTHLEEQDAWSLEPGGAYYTLRNGSTLLAFRLGRDAPATTGVHAVAAHLDSPNLRLKPLPDVTREGYRQLGVEVYGGAILATWADRDLGLAGRVLVETDGGMESRLVRIDRPICRVANVAIHLNRTVNSEGLKLDKQKHMPPLFGLVDGAEDERTVAGLLAGELGIDASRILSHDLGLFDLTPSRVGGVDGEFLFAPRLDNLGSSHAGLVAMIDAHRACPDAPDTSWLLALYDHEECGSNSRQGAMGTFFADVIRRMATGHPAAGSDPAEECGRTFARSFLISADMAHAVHPNYAELHEPGHRPALNQGPVIKRNENQRYATDGQSAARFRSLCRDAGFEPQEFVNRTDLPCGSTIGPITAAAAGIETVDVGNPMLSMHSAREMCGAWDQDPMIEAMTRLFA